jgi:hypothetical protein
VTDRYQDLRDSETVGIVTAVIVRGTHDQRQKSVTAACDALAMVSRWWFGQ